MVKIRLSMQDMHVNPWVGKICSKKPTPVFLPGNPASVPRGDGRPSLGTHTLHVHLLSDQVLIRKRLQGGLLEAVSLPTKVKQGTFLLRKLPIEPGGEIRTGAGDVEAGRA